MLVFEVTTPLPLADTIWHLSGLAQNDAVVSTAVDEQITLTLQEGQANGFAGCNDYFGAYELNGNGLKFGAIGSTRKACEGDPGRRETEFLTALERVTNFRIERAQLTLLDSGGNLVMSFVAPLITVTPLSADILKNAAYKLPPHNTTVKLVDGHYEAGAGADYVSANRLDPSPSAT